MNRGKDICKALKYIRRQIADENGIKLEISECTFKGECRGTCPKCEAELRYLNSQMRSRRSSGRTVKIAGIAAGALALLSPLTLSADKTFSNAQPETTVIQMKAESGVVNGITVTRYFRNDSAIVDSIPYNFLVKNMRTGVEVHTDNKGMFKIEASLGEVLRFRGMFFKTMRTPVTSYENTTIELKRANILLGEMYVIGKKPRLGRATTILNADSVEIIATDSKGKHVKFDGEFDYLSVMQTNHKGKILNNDDNSRYGEFLEYDINTSGNIIVNYDEILENINPINGNYPEIIVLRLGSDSYKNTIDTKIKIPEAVLRRYLSGNILF